MTRNERAYILEKKRKPKNFEFFFNLSVVLAPLVILVYAFIIDKREDGFLTPFFIVIAIALLLFTIYGFYRINEERKFHLLKIEVPFLTVKERLSEIANWTVRTENDALIIVDTNWSAFSWGERVTILKVSEIELLINVKANGRSPFTFDREKPIIDTIRKTL